MLLQQFIYSFWFQEYFTADSGVLLYSISLVVTCPYKRFSFSVILIGFPGVQKKEKRKYNSFLEREIQKFLNTGTASVLGIPEIMRLSGWDFLGFLFNCSTYSTLLDSFERFTVMLFDLTIRLKAWSVPWELTRKSWWPKSSVFWILKHTI